LLNRKLSKVCEKLPPSGPRSRDVIVRAGSASARSFALNPRSRMRFPTPADPLGSSIGRRDRSPGLAATHFPREATRATPARRQGRRHAPRRVPRRCSPPSWFRAQASERQTRRKPRSPPDASRVLGEVELAAPIAQEDLSCGAPQELFKPAPLQPAPRITSIRRSCSVGFDGGRWG
jgi:hypothetical protein